jgi:PPOX class probable F420-dependent enzyme
MRMSPEEIRDLLEQGRRVQVSTNGDDGWPHIVPMSYVVDDGCVVLWTDGNSRKVKNLRLDARITCVVEMGEILPEFRAVQIRGRADIVDDLAESRRIGQAMFERYSDGPPPPEALAYAAVLAEQRLVVRVNPVRTVSWDHRKVMVNLGEIGS